MNLRKLFESNQAPATLEKELTPEELREKLRDPSYLPTHEDINHAFMSKDGSFDTEAWKKFCNDNECYEFLNEEFISALGDYLGQRVKSLGNLNENPITILEVGAGNGRLCHFLNQKIEAQILKKINLVATDSGKGSGMGKIEPLFPVEMMDYKDALQKYQPKIVINSWMPSEIDFTQAFRDSQSVDEYILIGEPDSGMCGHSWLTWGWKFYEENLDGEEGKENEEAYEKQNKPGQAPPYMADGFESEMLDSISQHQICRVDDGPQYSRHSVTMTFRRRKD